MKINLLAALFIGAANLCATPVWAAETSEAPPFSIVGDSGKLNLSDFRGKVVYLDFFASWCSPCRASFKWLNEAHDRYSDQGLVVLAINVDKEKELAAQFLKENPAKFRVGFDAEGRVAQTYRIKGMPSAYLIDRKGQMRLAHVGYRNKDKDMLDAEVVRLLAEQPAN